jgi:hypothetical protein
MRSHFKQLCTVQLALILASFTPAMAANKAILVGQFNGHKKAIAEWKEKGKGFFQTDVSTIRSAMILADEGGIDMRNIRGLRVRSLKFHFRKYQWGVIFKQTCNPLLRIEYHKENSNTLEYKTVGFNRKGEDYICEFDKTDYIRRIAFVARVDMDPTPREYAKFDLNGIQLDEWDGEINYVTEKATEYDQWKTPADIKGLLGE